MKIIAIFLACLTAKVIASPIELINSSKKINAHIDTRALETDYFLRIEDLYKNLWSTMRGLRNSPMPEVIFFITEPLLPTETSSLQPDTQVKPLYSSLIFGLKRFNKKLVIENESWIILPSEVSMDTKKYQVIDQLIYIRQ